MDEGVIKYRINWQRQALVHTAELAALVTARNRAHKQEWIGFDEQLLVGYGNISLRLPDSNRFYISGSQTGHVEYCSEEHFAVVTQVDIPNNELWCKGLIKASSEALTHAAIYEVDLATQAVIHIHHEAGWKHLLKHGPFTPDHVPYGTPQMAQAIQQLIAAENDQSVFAMAGHQDGILCFGSDLQAAAQQLQSFLATVEN